MSLTKSTSIPAYRPLRVFLCHSTEDKQVIRDLYRRLKTDGFAPWLDEEELLPGQDWREEIPAAVRACDVVIICLSRTSVNKEGYLQREIRDAIYTAEEKPEGTIFIIPVRIEPDVEIPKRLSRWQWANLFQNEGYAQIVRALKTRENSRSREPLTSPNVPPPVRPLRQADLSFASDDSLLETILQEYDNSYSLLEDFSNICVHLISELLMLQKIKAQSVTARVKDRNSLTTKLKSRKTYTQLSDVIDLVSVRVITHSQSEIDIIGALVEKEFVVDPVSSIDKRKGFDADRFGYLSLHYVCSILPQRLRLVENQRFKNLRFEIQIRSILQHAWAQIEHDFGYKSDYGFPQPVRRRFSQIAGLLEIADQEFDAIRNGLKEYESLVESGIRTVGIDNISLKFTIERDLIIREIDEHLANAINASIKEDNESILQILSDGLPSVGITTIEELIAALKRQKPLILCQAVARLKGKDRLDVHRGVSVLQLLWVLIGLQRGEEGILRFNTEEGQEVYQANRDFAREVMKQIQECQGRY